MVNLLHSAKSGSDWGSNKLLAYNIVIHPQSSHTFMGGTLPALNDIFISGDITSPELSDHTFQLLQYLNLASKANIGQESVVDDLTKELLRLLKYEE